MKKINHTKIFVHGFRTALIFLAGFIIYELLLDLEKEWNKINPEHKTYNLHKKRGLKFFLILLVDLIILYTLQLFFGHDNL
jgi:hypothetical protein